MRCDRALDVLGEGEGAFRVTERVSLRFSVLWVDGGKSGDATEGIMCKMCRTIVHNVCRLGRWMRFTRGCREPTRAHGRKAAPNNWPFFISTMHVTYAN